ncbi:hypothetical protein O3G_MSEX001629 [Manduca sexta]|uniref:CWF19-like protein 2 homolog n=1 Tax=Manduca sexta TaxID=7130 RepID=A0A922CCT5_MANSE|nr:hypothetical protein O3G_MSEX001629 [Manduca sexta]
MKEKKHKREKSHKSKKHKSKKAEYRPKSPSSSDSSDSDKWVEKDTSQKQDVKPRDEWMAMTGMLKTYTKEDIKPKRTEKDKKHIDSYNPGTSSRELNPYWKDGGTGLPLTSDAFSKTRDFIKPVDEDDYYTKTSRSYRKDVDYTSQCASSSSKSDQSWKSSRFRENCYSDQTRRSSNWRKNDEKNKGHTETSPRVYKQEEEKQIFKNTNTSTTTEFYDNPEPKEKESKYLTDDKMNKLAAKIVKAEIMGNKILADELKSKLEAAREYRKQNPNIDKEDVDDGVMLMTTNSVGNSRPLTKVEKGDPRSKGGKRKAETHVSGERAKYFGNDDKYNLAQMFQEEKYGSNYNNEAELAKITSKHKNPNDDLEDIFVDEISKNRNDAKDSEIERQRAINQHKKIEKSLDGCEYCIDSKNMLKHLMVSCGDKVYLAVPARQSLTKNQCIISTIHHSMCVTALDEDVWEEILIYRKALTQFFNSNNMDVVFYETASKLNRYPHIVINCVPMPRDVGDMASIYFKKALLECESEWSMNKKVVELKGKNIRKGVPKGLPYFWIDFGMDPGFAHVIEDHRLFPKYFAEEIIAGILDLDHNLWKNPRRENSIEQRQRALDFIKEWKPFDPVKNK